MHTLYALSHVCPAGQRLCIGPAGLQLQAVFATSLESASLDFGRLRQVSRRQLRRGDLRIRYRMHRNVPTSIIAGTSDPTATGLGINFSELHLVEYTACVLERLLSLPFTSWQVCPCQSFSPLLHWRRLPSSLFPLFSLFWPLWSSSSFLALAGDRSSHSSSLPPSP